MKIFIGCDHAAFEVKTALFKEDGLWGDEAYLVDCGTDSSTPCHYPVYARSVALAVQKGEGKGILLCGSGIGMSMAANRYAFVRAALCRAPEEALLSVEHNDSNILCLGARISSLRAIKEMIKAWAHAKFQGGRHTHRLDQFNRLGEILDQK